MKTSNIHKDDIKADYNMWDYVESDGAKEDRSYWNTQCSDCKRWFTKGGLNIHKSKCSPNRDKENKIKSKCCNSWVVAEHEDEGTSFYKCVACRKACDIASPSTPDWKKKNEMEIDSDVFVKTVPDNSYEVETKPSKKTDSIKKHTHLWLWVNTDIKYHQFPEEIDLFGIAFFKCNSCRKTVYRELIVKDYWKQT